MRSTGNLHELWRTGHELDYAWRVVPDPDLQLQYRASHDNYRKREFAISLMKRELAECLLDQKFKAIGIKDAPSPSGELAFIPAHFFDSSSAIGWNESAVRAHGHAFTHVRVIGLPRSPRQAALGDPAPSAEVVEPSSSKPGQMGPRPKVPLVREVIRQMRKEGLLAGMLQKQRIQRVRERAKAEYPDSFPGDNHPARTTILKALNEEGY
jgi:hypothetical protein